MSEPQPSVGEIVGILPVERVSIAQLKPHPLNYRKHTREQLAHLVASLDEHGFYKNIVIARDDTILAGHGIVEAMQMKGWTQANATRMPLDAMDPRALKILAGDNEVAKLARVDDRALVEILRSVGTENLKGTGVDQATLDLLFAAARPIEGSNDPAQHWNGMPEFEQPDEMPWRTIHVHFKEQGALDEFAKLMGQPISDKTRYLWHPRVEGVPQANLRYDTQTGACRLCGELPCKCAA